MEAIVALLAVAVLFLGLLVAGLLRSHAEVLRGLHDLGVNLDPNHDDGPPSRHQSHSGQPGIRPGVPQPRSSDTEAFDLVGLDSFGEVLSVAVESTNRLTLLAFLSSSCLTCRDFWKEFDSERLDVPGGARLVIVTKGLEAESESAIRNLSPRVIQTVLSTEAWINYQVPVAPYFIMVDGESNRIVGEGAATSWDQVRNLMGQAMADIGLAAERGRKLTSGSASQSARRNGEARAQRIDDELRAAGINPGDPRLYQQPFVEP